MASVALLAPAGDIVAVAGNSQATVLLVAQPHIQNGVLDPTRVHVVFQIDDAPYQAGWHEAGFYYLAVTFDVDSDEDEVFHSIQAAALGSEAHDHVESDTHLFRVRAAEDADGNGFPDDPFAALPEAGDMWISTEGAPECPRMVTLLAMRPVGGGESSVFIQNPEVPDQILVVRAANALIGEEEQGMLIAAAACSPDRLYWPYDASAMASSEPGPPALGRLYADVNLIVSRDRGRTFDDVPPARLAQHSVHLSLNGMPGRDGFQNMFHGYPTMVDSDLALGPRLVPLSGSWSTNGIQDLGVTTPGGRHGVVLTRLGGVAPFEMPHPAELEVAPSPLLPYNFGVVKINYPVTADFILTNVGGEILSCEIELVDESGVFFAQSDTRVLLEPQTSHTLKVQFIPGEAREYNAQVVLRGGVNSPRTIFLVGRGMTETKSVRPLGCGAPTARATNWKSDALVLLGALTLLFLTARRRHTSRG